ncbi:hypothetical protein E2C01_039191 [Portunus trituberculatus]|uniref:Uncharacterized protein n=1 Tax=Portunus trituberculatus TaxID=210409 RepID=A0A5B7FE49_PORTR|nr:hypothetical protein [Portunus trituberculatus]
MEKRKKLSGSREVADLACETSSSGLSRKEDSPPQGPPTAVSCSGSSSEGRISTAFDSLLMKSAGPAFTLVCGILQKWAREFHKISARFLREISKSTVRGC